MTTTDTTTLPTPPARVPVTTSGQIGRTLALIEWLDQHRGQILTAEMSGQMSVRFDPDSHADLRMLWSTQDGVCFDDAHDVAQSLGLVYAGSTSGGVEHGPYVHHKFVGAPGDLFVTLAWLEDVAS